MPYIYVPLNWAHPWLVLLLLLGVSMLIIVVSLAIFGLYKLREQLCKRHVSNVSSNRSPTNYGATNPTFIDI